MQNCRCMCRAARVVCRDVTAWACAVRSSPCIGLHGSFIVFNVGIAGKRQLEVGGSAFCGPVTVALSNFEPLDPGFVRWGSAAPTRLRSSSRRSRRP